MGRERACVYVCVREKESSSCSLFYSVQAFACTKWWSDPNEGGFECGEEKVGESVDRRWDCEQGVLVYG